MWVPAARITTYNIATDKATASRFAADNTAKAAQTAHSAFLFPSSVSWTHMVQHLVITPDLQVPVLINLDRNFIKLKLS